MSRPRWLEPLPDAELMRATDRWAIETRGMPSLDLMERAGEGLARVIAEHVPSGRIAIVCGKGNNGGDGLVAARRLRAAGRDVDVLRLWEPEELSGDPAAQLARLPGAAPVRFEAARLDGAAGIVDALLGTGSTGAPRGRTAEAVAAIGAASGTVIAADVPSGVDAGTGEVADADIGIPPGAPGEPDTGLILPNVLRGLPSRSASSTKFSSGNVVVVGGSSGLTGAPTMAALAATRAGAGYVTVAAPARLELAFAVRLLEAMFVGLPEDGGALASEALEPAVKAVGRASAVVLGPGLGKSPGAQGLVRALVERIDVPLVIDADGLNALAGRLELLRRRRWPTVLTPHAGELGRLLEVEPAAIGRARLEHARAAAERAQALVVLKGDDTLIAAPSGRVAISPGGAPALATAGTGDVLAGVCGALLARGVSNAHAACAAVYAHVRAGRLAAEPHGPDCVVASDVIAALPAALAP